MLVVTIREGEERGICSARELLRIVEDQIEERSVVVPCVEQRLEIAPQENQLKFVDVEGMRVVTSSRIIARQIKSDKVESVVMDGPKVGEFGKVGREQKLKSIVTDGVRSGKEDKVKNVVMDGVKTGKVGKLQN